jgi:hypothetical protein
MDTAGLHDPYWYEGGVGLLSTVDMLNPDSEIESVTFQKTGTKGLDDVVIAHRNGRTIYTQIKHTRVDDTLTFGDLVSRPSAEDGQEGVKSLLAHIAEAWREARSECEFAEARIYTNRSTSNRPYLHRPALTAFWQRLSEQIQDADKLSSISFPTEWHEAWREWLAQLECLGNDACRLEFLKVLHLDADQGGLEELDTELLSRLRGALGVTEEQAAELLKSLYAALRKWTTSLRKNDAITAEEVWAELGAEEDTVGLHALPPPAPFFPSRIDFLDQVATALRGASQPIVFMTGEPGCGKTSIVSALVNRSDPFIDLRYHAYRPITPDMTDLSLDTGETATAEVLWGDLLVQLRRHLTGRLAQHRVPLRISFLSIQDRRREVLRLASALAEERGRRVVIAIDGIDHAARANRPDRLPFLDSLPEPDEVPDNVCLFLVGQPSEAWPAYPYWLREASSAVVTYRVPKIDDKDIRTLMSDRVLSAEPDVHDALVRVIADVTEHNTLSVVFAVEEAVALPQPRELHERLRQRALAGSLRSYYDGIWGNATAVLPQQFSARERIAACVAVAREHLTGQLLSHVFADDSISPHDWNEVLRNLRPLLVEDDRGFRVLHNDVRVHLTLHAGADQSRLREISNLFLCYYEGDYCTPEARHSHLFEFARRAGELKKASAAYTPLWVAEAAALDRPMEELFLQARLALQGLKETADWDLIHNVVCGIETLQQLDRSDGWVGRSRPAQQAAPVLASECGVLQRDLWDEETLSRMFAEAQLLSETDAARARSLLLRWLEGIDPDSFVRTLDENRTRRFPHTRGGRLDDSTRTALQSWGALAHQLEVHPAKFIDGEQLGANEGDSTDRPDAGVEEENRDTQDDDTGAHVGARDDDEKRYAWAYFAAGWLQSAARRSLGLSWARSVRIAFNLGCSQLDVVAALDELTSRGLWFEVIYLLRRIRPEANLLPALRARCMILAILSRHSPTTARWTQPNIDTSVCQRGFSGATDDGLLAACAFAFVRAWKEPSEQTSFIRDTFLDAYFEGQRDSRTRTNVAVLIRASAIAGRIWRTCASVPHRSLAETEATDAAQSLTTLLNPDFTRPVSIPLGYMSVAGRIFRLMLAGLEDDASFRPQLISIVKDHAISFPVAQTAEPTWRFLRNEDEHGILSQWWEHWCGDVGRAWSLSVSERDDIVRTLAGLARENGWTEQANAALRRLGWGRVGYSGHKDYSFDEPLAWFQCLSERDASAWRSLGMRLLAVSDYASEVGDNRFSFEVRMAISDAMAREGISAARSLADARSTGESIEWLEWDSYMFFNWLIQCTGRDDLSRQDLLYIWCLGIGVMWWEYDSDYADLAALREGIIERTRIAGYEDIKVDLERLGPLEFAAPEPTDRRGTPLWMEGLNNGEAGGVGDPDQFVRKVCDAAKNGEASTDELIQAAQRLESCSPDLRCEPGVATMLLTRFLSSRDREFLQWTYDGSQRVVAKLVPHVEDAVRLEVAQDVARAGVAQPANYRFFGAAENLGLLCRYRGKTLPTEDVRRFAERQVEMHWDWSQGFGHLPSINCPILSVPAEPETNWTKFAVDVLSVLLYAEDTHTVAAALRGLYSLLELEHPIPLVVERLAKSEDKKIRYWWLLLCERLGLEHPHLRSVIEQSVTNLLDDTSLPVSVQAWVTLMRLRQRAGGRPPEWPFPRPGVAPLPTTPNGQKLVFSKANQLGGVQFSSGVRSVLGTISRICIITGVDARDLESRIATRGWHPQTPRKPARRRGNSTALLFGDHSAHDVLDDELYRDLCVGRFRGVPPVRIAQAILPSDDPFILLRTAPLYQAGPWPPSDLRQMRDEESSVILRDRLRQILLEDGIAESEVVVGGAISSFDFKTDYEIFHTLVWMAAPAELNANWHRSSPSARTFQYVFDAAYEGNDDDSVRPFTYLAGSIHEFSAGGLRVLPGSLWRALGWRPSANDGSALRWETPDGATIRFEALQGPPRSQPQDAHHRQPRLHRWITSKAVIAEAEEILGGVIVPRLQFEERPFKAP